MRGSGGVPLRACGVPDGVPDGIPDGVTSGVPVKFR
jgi:hypothetical protein